MIPAVLQTTLGLRPSLVRRVAANLLLLAAFVTSLLLYARAAQPSPAVIHEQVGKATVYFAADRTILFSSSECVHVQWRVEGIQAIMFPPYPGVGQEEHTWCVGNNALFSKPLIQVQFADGNWRDYSIAIEVMQPMLLYTVLPLLFVAAWILRLHLPLPATLRSWIATEDSRFYGLIEPFLVERRFNLNLIYIFIAINSLVWLNGARHNPRIAYDSSAHHAYVNVLSELRLPEPDESYEFFSPPLPYVVPALALHLRQMTNTCTTPMICEVAVQKLGQFQNVILSLGITLLLIKIAGLIRPSQPDFKILSLAIFGMLPVYYKTLSFLRGEPFVVFFCLYLIYEFLRLLSPEHEVNWRDAFKLGVGGGLILLSRQWGALILVALVLAGALLVIKGKNRRVFLKTGAVALMLAALIGGWFYLSLQLRYGSFLSFNREARAGFFENHRTEFYFGLGNGQLFTSPFGLAFSQQIWPTLYTEIWGDYEGYFVTSFSEPMPDYWLPYMGRVNAVSLFPTLLLLAGIGIGFSALVTQLRRSYLDQRAFAGSLLLLVILVSLLGYLWFLIRYPNIDGDTVKATYILHIFPLLSLLAAELLLRIQARSRRIYAANLVLLALVLIHNFPAMLTRHTVW